MTSGVFAGLKVFAWVPRRSELRALYVPYETSGMAALLEQPIAPDLTVVHTPRGGVVGARTGGNE